MPEKPNILEIRYITVQYSKDVFIYLSRARVPAGNISWDRELKSVFCSWLKTQSEIYFSDSAAKPENFISLTQYLFLAVSLYLVYFQF